MSRASPYVLVMVVRNRVISWMMSRPEWIPASVPSVVVRSVVTSIIPWAVESAVVPRVIESAVIPRIVESSIVPWVVESAVVPRVIEATVIPWVVSPYAAVPWVVVSAPVPRTSDAVRGVPCPCVVISPVVAVVGNGHCSTQLAAEADSGGHFFRDINGVLLVSEEIYGRTLRLVNEGLGLCLFRHSVCLCLEGRGLPVYSILEPLTLRRWAEIGKSTA